MVWILSCKALRVASFRSAEELRMAIEAFVAAYGPTAKTFVWYMRDVKRLQLKNTIANFC